MKFILNISFQFFVFHEPTRLNTWHLLTFLIFRNRNSSCEHFQVSETRHDDARWWAHHSQETSLRSVLASRSRLALSLLKASFKVSRQSSSWREVEVRWRNWQSQSHAWRSDGPNSYQWRSRSRRVVLNSQGKANICCSTNDSRLVQRLTVQQRRHQ